ncbi:hypothetical protein [Viridibacterium curvum]|uniref:Uncharacterized protein n=1 Tax=Viridibacterium curvum TaxID=1101404 RepID=A0ABP9QZV8_9RHOO
MPDRTGALPADALLLDELATLDDAALLACDDVALDDALLLDCDDATDEAVLDEEALPAHAAAVS